MSAIDRAFIRAYEIDDDAPSVAMPPARQSAPLTTQSTRTQPTGPSTPHFRVVAEPAAAAPPTARPAATSPAAGERRPLSTFAKPAPTVEARFRPELEVDAFRWSAVSDSLVGAHAARWAGAVQSLLAADDRGCSLIGIAAAARGDGATTIAGCLARLLVAAGKTVAVVDGNFGAPGLAGSMGLAADLGWEDVLAGRVPLADAVIHSLGDQLAVLPLTQGGQPAAEKLDAIHASITAGVLRYHYDLVLFDLGAVADAAQASTACRLARRCRLDGVLLATAAGGAALGSSWLTRGAPELAAVCLGVLENQHVSS